MSSTTFSLSNSPTLLSVGAGIDQLTLLSSTVHGPFDVSGVTAGEVIDAGGSVPLEVTFAPTHGGAFSEVLELTTDQYANFGQTGEVFDIQLDGIGVPEPAGWVELLLGFGLSGLAFRKFRRTRFPESGQA